MYSNYEYTGSAQDDHAAFLKQIGKAAGFCERDLIENRGGQLTGSQMMRVFFSALLPFVGMAMAAVGLLALAIGFLTGSTFLVAKLSLVVKFGNLFAVLLSALFFGVIAFIVKFLLASGRMLSLFLDLMQGKVAPVSGRMTTSRSDDIEDGVDTILKRKTEKFSLVIRNEYFEVSPEAHSVMAEKSGQNFCFYVTPRSRFLVSIESAGPAKAADGTTDAFRFQSRTEPV